MAVKVPAVIVWVMTMCSFIDRYQGFTEIWCFHLQGKINYTVFS